MTGRDGRGHEEATLTSLVLTAQPGIVSVTALLGIVHRRSSVSWLS